MIDDDLRTALLPAFPGMALIHSNENGPRPSGVYATLRIETARRGPAIIGELNSAGVRELVRHGNGTLELQCFGEGSYDALDLAVLRLNTEAVQAAALGLNLSFGTSDRIQSVPALRNDSSWEQRAVVSLPFAYTRAASESLSWIETVTGQIEVNDRATPYSATIVE